jgi:regulatory protein
MPTITAIEKQKRRRRADVSLDSGLTFSLGLDLIATAGLAVGDELSHVRRQELEADDQKLGAVQAALRLLAAGPRSEQDLRRRLSRQRGFRKEAADQAIARMRDLGYLDDAAFARFWVETRQVSTPRSKRALRFELSQKGVSREQVDQVLEDRSDADAAYAAAQRRLRSLRGLDYITFHRRLGTFLNSRGFSYSVARATIQRCWAELDEDSRADPQADELKAHGTV